MADIKISQLPVASVVNDADIVVLNQGGDTKTAAKSLIVAGLATTDQISGFTNSAQVQALASAQISAITPASIGALSTDAASGFATTAQIVGIAVTSQLSGFATTDQISGFTNSAQVQSLASAQIAAITPASIGAFATSAIIGIGNGGTGATDAPSALAALGGITSAQVPAFDTAQLSAYVPKAGSTMDGRLIMAATTDQAKANIGGALLGVAAPASSIAGDVWISNQSKLTFSPSTGVAVTAAGLSQQNSFSAQQIIGVGGAVDSLSVTNSGTGRAATFAANSTAPAVAITQTGTGAALSVDSKGILFYDNTTQSGATSHLAVDLAAIVNQAGTLNIGVTPNTFTYLTFGGVQLDGVAIGVGTTAIFTNQADLKQNGPWIVTQANTGSSGFVLTRPAWFSGIVKQGIEISVGTGNTRYGYIYNVGRSASGFITVGTDNISVSVSNYNQNAITTAQISGFATTTQISTLQPALTSASPLAINSGGTGATTAAAALSNLGGITSAAIAGLATTTQLSAYQPALTSAAPLAISLGGTGATTAAAALTSLGAMSATQAAGGDLSGNLPSPTVAKIQGISVTNVTPLDGQVLQYDTATSTWIAGAVPNGGSGGGGQMFFFNYNTAADAPTTGLPTTPTIVKELGRVSDTTGTSYTSGTLSQVGYDLVVHFVTDVLDPSVTAIPAGLFDFNFWASSTGTTSNETIVQLKVFKYDGTTATLLATSDDISIYDPTVTAQYIASVVIPQTTVSASDRLYIQFLGKATQNNKTITFNFGATQPSHVHTTIPSVGGSGLVKVINGVFQSPASKLLNEDVATNAAISLSKLAMSEVSVSAGAGLTGGGDLSTSRTLALATTGIAAISGAGSSVAVPVISANIYGQITALTTEAIAVGGSGTVTSITAGTGLTGGTITASGTIALATTGVAALSGIGSSAAVPVISVDTYGRITALQTASLSQLGAGTVTSIAMTSQVAGLSFTPETAITNNGTFNLTGTLGITGGGTGASTAAAALTNLGGASTARTISAGTGLSGGGDLTADRTLAIAALSPDPTGTYGSTSQIPSLTVNNIGQVTAVSLLSFRAPNVQTFSTAGTWTKPANARRVRVELWGGGGGGGGGARVASGVLGLGGGGGGSGSYVDVVFDANLLAATQAVTIAAGGTAGPGATTDNTNGGVATSGGATTFGSLLTAFGGGRGVEGTVNFVTGAGAGGSGGFQGNTGAASSTTGAAGLGGNPANTASICNRANGSGASGGGIATTPANVAGGTGSRFLPLNIVGAIAGTAGGGNGNAGTSNLTNAGVGIIGAGGGSGGGSNIAGTGGNGGAGGMGAGGGGGGACLNGAVSGAGGAGGNGYAVITTYFY